MDPEKPLDARLGTLAILLTARTTCSTQSLETTSLWPEHLNNLPRGRPYTVQQNKQIGLFVCFSFFPVQCSRLMLSTAVVSGHLERRREF